MVSTNQLEWLINEDGFYTPIWGDDSLLIERKKQILRSVLDAFRREYGNKDSIVVYHVPGRLEFTAGKHTDYVGLPVPNFAVDRGFIVISAPSQEPIVRIAENNPKWSAISFRLEDLITDKDALSVPFQSNRTGDDQWRNYPITNLQRVFTNFHDEVNLGGASMAFGSDLPPASGMSSSSALMIMTFLGYASVNGLIDNLSFAHAMRGAEPRNIIENIALYLACCENGSAFTNDHTHINLPGKPGVGTFGGSQDHLAILLGRLGYLAINDFCPIRHMEDIGWPDDLAVVVCYTSPASKTQEARDGFNALRRKSDSIAQAYSESIGQPDRFKLIGEILRVNPGIDHEGMLELLRSKQEYRDERLAERWEMAYTQATQHLPLVREYLKT